MQHILGTVPWERKPRQIEMHYDALKLPQKAQGDFTPTCELKNRIKDEKYAIILWDVRQLRQSSLRGRLPVPLLQNSHLSLCHWR